MTQLTNAELLSSLLIKVQSEPNLCIDIPTMARLQELADLVRLPLHKLRPNGVIRINKRAMEGIILRAIILNSEEIMDEISDSWGVPIEIKKPKYKH